jgi:hypothetical protein
MADDPNPSPRGRGQPWRALLFSLAGFGVLIAAIYAFVASPLDPWGEKVTVRHLTIHYVGDVPRETVEKVADFLLDRGIGRSREAEARLRRHGDGWLVDLFMHPNSLSDTEVTALMERLHKEFCRDVFGGAPLVLRACDPVVETNRSEHRREPKVWKEVGP